MAQYQNCRKTKKGKGQMKNEIVFFDQAFVSKFELEALIELQSSIVREIRKAQKKITVNGFYFSTAQEEYWSNREKKEIKKLGYLEKICNRRFGEEQMSEVYKERWYVAEICNELYINRDGDNEYLADVKDGETDEAWKRAHLMAAAPELLNALESLMSEIREYLNWDGDVVEGPDDPAAFFIKEYTNAERIIEKARGENNE